MADYYPLISRAVAGLDNRTSESRRVLYNRARAAQLEHLESQQPPLFEKELERERAALEAAIQRVENDLATNDVTLPTSSSLQNHIEQSRLKLRDGPELVWEGRTDGQKILGFLLSTAVGAVFAIAIILLSFVPAIYSRGTMWVSNHPLEYMALPFDITFGICVVIFLPLLLFRTTRPIAAFGFFVSSSVFAATTGMAGVVATYTYLGTFWTLVGLFGLLVGVVPLGIVASITNADWTAVWLLCGGLVLCCGARLTCAWVTNKIPALAKGGREKS